MSCQDCVKYQVQLSKSRTATTKAREHLSKKVTRISELNQMVNERDYTIKQARRLVAGLVETMDYITTGNLSHKVSNVKCVLIHAMEVLKNERSMQTP